MKKRLRLIIIAFGVSFVVMAGLCLYSLKRFTTLNDYSAQVDHTNQVINHLFLIEKTINDIDIEERGFMVSKDSVYIDRLFDEYRAVLPATERLKELIKDNKEQSQTLILLRAAMSERISNVKENLEYFDTARNTNVSKYFLDGQRNKEDAIRYLNLMRERENNMLQERFAGKMKYQKIAYSTVQNLLMVFAVITVFLFMILLRELRRRMQYQKELQNKISELKHSYSELEQIAFAVSHDLQEPLRKIQVFGNRLQTMRKAKKEDDGLETIERMNQAAFRMQDLVNDLMNLTSLVKEDYVQEINLNDVLHAVLKELQPNVKDKKASVQTEPMPVVWGHQRQLQLLFRSVLENALKFTKEATAPVITIRSDRVSGEELTSINKAAANQSFYRITITDNGIGFDNQFVEKIFKIFQRLHTQQSEYPGKGIGLAIAQRVIVNHNGYITAQGHPGIGATFKLYFPVKE